MAWTAKKLFHHTGSLATGVLHACQRMWVGFWAYFFDTMRKPFQRFDWSVLHQQSLEDFERSRRLAILRCIALSVTCAAVFILLVIVFFRPPVWITIIRSVVTLTMYGIALRLSYTRLAHFAGYLLLGGVYAWILVFVAADPSGVSIRTASMLSVVSLVILGARFVLPVQQARVTVVLMSLLALGEAFFLPLKGPYPSSLIYPHQWVLVYLACMYGITIVLSWIAMESSRDALETYAVAYAHEYELEQQKDQFLQIASHELRAPLTPLLLTSLLLQRHVLKQDLDPSKILFSAKEVSRHVKRMDGMIDLLLDINRVDQRRFLLQYEQCDVAQIIRDVIETQQPASRRRVDTMGLDTPVMIEGDARRLWQVFSNLIVNAIKYTPENTLIAVSLVVLHASEDDREWAHITVRDEGPGIAAVNLPHLFDRYYRIEENAQDHIEGWGLGLFLCYEIVTAHGGSIGVSSEPNKGTMFEITLPCTRAARVAVADA